MKHRIFSFQPRSTRHLWPGDFWAIPLRSGAYACGRVVELKKQDDGSIDSRVFLAGLLDWISDAPPSDLTISGHSTIIQGQAHVRTIQRSGVVILGHRSLAADGIEPARMLSHAAGAGVMLQRGFSVQRAASDQERASLPVFPTFGLEFMARYAETHLFAG